MVGSKRARGVALPPIDASPEEIAQAIFGFNPDCAPLAEELQPEKPRRLVSEPIELIDRGEGSTQYQATRRWLERKPEVQQASDSE